MLTKNSKRVLVFVIVFILYRYNIDKVENLLSRVQCFEGVIFSKEISLGRNPSVSVKQNSNEVVLHDISNKKIYDIIEPGDYIIKKRWAINYALIKKNDTLVFQP